MYILRAFALLLFLTRVVLAQQPTPILTDAKLTPGNTFDVTAEDVCVPGYAKKVRERGPWLGLWRDMALGGARAEVLVARHWQAEYERCPDDLIEWLSSAWMAFERSIGLTF